MKTLTMAAAASAVLLLATAAQAAPRTDGNAAGASARPAPTKEEVARAEECRPKMTLEVLPYGMWAPVGRDKLNRLAVSMVMEWDQPQMQELVLTNTDIRFPTEWTMAKVDGNQTRAIVDLLLAEGFFARARRNPAPGGPSALCCVLSVTGESVHYVENLGWGPAMLARLDALRAVLEKGSPAAGAMDQWMARFEPFRQWEKAAVTAGKAPLRDEAPKVLREPSPEEIRNEFIRLNPGYQERAGMFYEKEYLPKAAGQLAKAAGLGEKEEAAARKVLREFLYDWLESYARGGGRISSDDLDACLARMDKRMQDALSPAGHAAYLTWRKDETGADNALAFLMNPRFAVRTAQTRPSRPE